MRWVSGCGVGELEFCGEECSMFVIEVEVLIHFCCLFGLIMAGARDDLA